MGLLDTTKKLNSLSCVSYQINDAASAVCNKLVHACEVCKLFSPYASEMSVDIELGRVDLHLVGQDLNDSRDGGGILNIKTNLLCRLIRNTCQCSHGHKSSKALTGLSV